MLENGHQTRLAAIYRHSSGSEFGRVIDLELNTVMIALNLYFGVVCTCGKGVLLLSC